MVIHYLKNMEKVSDMAAAVFAAEIINKPDLVVGLATGSSPIGLYAALAEMKLDFSRVRTVNLDEYAGIPASSEHSYRHFMNENLFNKVGIPLANTHLPDGMAPDLTEACLRYDKAIDDLGGIDIQLLGIGFNGHIGFNEPSEAFSGNTTVVDLTQSTIEANSRLFDRIEDVPKQAITMGIRQIMMAKRIVLIAGAEKKDIVISSLFGPITPKVPASALQLHRDVTVLVALE